jgi:hypothetical protein
MGNPMNWLDRLLALAPRRWRLEHPRSPDCLNEVEIAQLAERRALPQDARIEAHLSSCRRCTHLLIETRAFVAATSAAQRRGVRTICVPILQSTIRDNPLAYAAADPAQVLRDWEVHAVNGLRLAVAPTARGALVVAVERDDRPVAGAAVSLVLMRSKRRAQIVSSSRTNRDGEATLGSLRRLVNAAAGGHYQVRVTLPVQRRRARHA